MQFSLFDDRNLGRIGYLQALKNFDLPAACEHLRTWLHTLDATPQVAGRLTAIERLQNELAEANGQRLDFLVRLYLDKEIPQFKVLALDQKVWREGLISALLQEMDGKVNRYLHTHLHSMEFYLEAGLFDEAESFAVDALKENPSDALLHQLRAWAQFHLKNEKKAFVYATRALFLEPEKCKARYLLPGDFHKTYDYLLYKMSDSQLALRRLPFVLWREGKTYIEAGNSRLSAFLEVQISENKHRAETDAAERQRQFNRLLYLAEAERLSLARGSSSPRLEELRQAMRALQEEWFSAYAASLSAFGNY